jgi:dihydroxyacetone kinase-like protein
MTPEKTRLLIERLAASMIAHSGELTDLDQAVGDGDHGVNMKRGFEAVLTDVANLAAKPLPEMLKTLGMVLVMKVGGASGPLYGTLFMELGKTLPAEPTRADFAAAARKAIDAVKARGKSETGQKTMLDVLEPALAAFSKGQDAAGIKAVVAAAVAATVPMLATRGRASFLGERSVGHMDPGARSSQLLIEAALDALAD